MEQKGIHRTASSASSKRRSAAKGPSVKGQEVKKEKSTPVATLDTYEVRRTGQAGASAAWRLSISRRAAIGPAAPWWARRTAGAGDRGA